MGGIKKGVRALRRTAKYARELHWLKRRLTLADPSSIELDFNLSSAIPPLIIEPHEPSSSTLAAAAAAGAPSCLICHDAYIQVQEQGQDSAPASFVSKLPSALAESFTKALGELILTSKLNPMEKGDLLAQLEASLYCTRCMGELREIVLLFEQFEKLKTSVGLKRVQMITRIQHSHSKTRTTKGGTDNDIVAALRAKLITNIPAPGLGHLRNPIKSNPIEETKIKIPKKVTKSTNIHRQGIGRPLKQQQQNKSQKAKPQVRLIPNTAKLGSKTPNRTKTTKKTMPPGLPVSKKAPKGCSVKVPADVKGGGQMMKVDDEIWEQVVELEEPEVKLENEEKVEEMEILDQVQNESLDPLDDLPKFNSMFMMDNEDVVGYQDVSLDPIKVLKCPECNELFMNQAELEQHSPTCGRPVLTCKCNLCGQIYNYKTILNHLKAVHYKKNELVEHNNGDSDAQEILQCPECRKTVKDLPYHSLFEHQVQFSCDACQDSSSVFKYYEKYQLHVIRTHPVFGLGHKCPVCGTPFSSLKALARHKSNYHDDGYSKYNCTQCSRRFRQESGLEYHIKSCHEQEFKCSICDVKFTGRHGRTYLNKHLLIHAGKVDRKYKCVQCTKAFTQPGKLKNHVNAIHGLNKEAYVCELCGKGFPIHNYLYIHLRSHETPEEKQARRLKAKAAAEARKLSGKPVLIPKGRPRIRPMQENKKSGSDYHDNDVVIVMDNSFANSFKSKFKL